MYVQMFHRFLFPTIALLAMPAKSSLAKDSDAFEMKFVKNEGEVYSFIGTQTVYYGCLSSGSFSGGVNCIDNVFGDPCFQNVKTCWWLDEYSDRTLEVTMPKYTVLVSLKKHPLPSFDYTRWSLSSFNQTHHICFRCVLQGFSYTY